MQAGGREGEGAAAEAGRQAEAAKGGFGRTRRPRSPGAGRGVWEGSRDAGGQRDGEPRPVKAGSHLGGGGGGSCKTDVVWLQQPSHPGPAAAAQPPPPPFPGESQQVKAGPVTRQVACAGPVQKPPGKEAQRRAEGPWGGVYVQEKGEELCQE